MNEDDEIYHYYYYYLPICSRAVHLANETKKNENMKISKTACGVCIIVIYFKTIETCYRLGTFL